MILLWQRQTFDIVALFITMLLSIILQQFSQALFNSIIWFHIHKSYCKIYKYKNHNTFYKFNAYVVVNDWNRLFLVVILRVT